jgi:succinoglycan biosynthesis transport protein ExoP
MDLNNFTQSLRLREYYYMALRHKLLFFTTTIAAVVIATFMAFTSPKIYQAQTVLLVEGGQKILSPLIDGLAISPSVQSRMRFLREELLSWQRLTLLVEKLKLDEKSKTPLEFEKLIKALRNSLSIKMQGNDIISIAHEGSDPKKSQEIVQTFSDIIITGNLTSADLEANSAIRFIKKQMESYREKLEESEKKLREFREIYASSLPIAMRMNEQLVALKMELNNLLVDNTDEHPRVQQTRQLIEQLEKQRVQYMNSAKEEGVAIDPEEFAKMATSVPLQEQQLAKLQRDYSVNESIYQKLLQRLETAKISQTLEDTENAMKFKILEPARLPLEPIKPNKPLFIMGGLIIGLGLGIALIYIIELSNTSIRNLDDARNLLELPIFGSIATIRPEELLMGERMREEVGV